MLTITTGRLIMREVVADDLPDLLPIYLSNPDQVMVNEGSQGEPGHYDLAMFQRDWWLASLTPGRHMLGVSLLATGTAIGLADYLEDNPDDGQPCLGQLMIHHDYQRQGYGAEAFRALAAYFRVEHGWPAMRAGLAHDNMTALAFCQRLGFRPITWEAPSRAERESAGQRRIVLACELPMG